MGGKVRITLHLLIPHPSFLCQQTALGHINVIKAVNAVKTAESIGVDILFFYVIARIKLLLIERLCDLRIKNGVRNNRMIRGVVFKCFSLQMCLSHKTAQLFRHGNIIRIAT